MQNKQPTVLNLAREAGIDPELALLTLWESGIEDIVDPSQKLDHRTAALARTVLCLPSRSQVNSVDFWQKQLGMTGAQFQEFLVGLGIEIVGRKFPKGVIRRIRHAVVVRRIESHSTEGVAEEKQPCVVKPEKEAEKSEEPRTEPFIWREIGHRPPQELKVLSPQQVEAVHWRLVEDFDGSPDPIKPPGLRSKSLLESAIHRTQTCLGNDKKYPSIEMATAALLHSLVLNHPFINGNKRTALVCMLAMLDMNGILLTCSEEDLFKMVIKLAQHKIVGGKGWSLADRETLAIADWICQNSRLIEKGERPIPWRRLRRILASFNCTLEFPGGVGNRINITRQILDGKGKKKTSREISTQAAYKDEGSEVDRDEIKFIRQKLELDEGHNIDSVSFYGQSPMESADFIGLYRKILRRLAKL
jgi:death-on-curing family protein